MRFTDRDRAESFGADAERYDRARPSYPAALVDDLMAGGIRRVLDVGCGTGKAGRLFMDRGCEVLGLEPDERMAAVARRHGLTVEVTTVEAWTPEPEAFDLVVSGQAWHWVDPSIGPARVGQALRPSGRLAVFWNGSRHQPATAVALDRAYEEFAAELRQESVVLGTMRRPFADDIAALAATELFEPAETRLYPWEQVIERDEWIDQLRTHSDHSSLPPERLEPLLAAVAKEIDGLGGAITVLYQTSMITAVRR